MLPHSETDHTMLRTLVLLLALLAPLASAEEAQQWLPVAGKVAMLPGELGGGCWGRQRRAGPPPPAAAVAAACGLPLPLADLCIPSPPALFSTPDGTSLADVEVWLQLEGSRRLLAFPLPDGSFSFSRVPLGVHTLGVEHRTLVFPTAKLDVGATRKGKVTAAVADIPGVSTEADGAGKCLPALGMLALGRRTPGGDGRHCTGMPTCLLLPDNPVPARSNRRCRTRCCCGRWRRWTTLRCGRWRGWGGVVARVS